MDDERTRSEYRLTNGLGQFVATLGGLRPPTNDDRDALAQLMLDAYRGTIDDEGETLDDARDAVDFMLGICLRDHSVVLTEEGVAIAMSLVTQSNSTDVYYIDPIAVAAGHKQAGIGRRMVEASLVSLAAAGVHEVGATITDGNQASERLFKRLGAERVGPWPPTPH